jgi:hypothetical protein
MISGMTTEDFPSGDQPAIPVAPRLRLPRLPKIKGLPRLRSLRPELRQVERAFYSLTPSLANAAARNRSRARNIDNRLRRYRRMLWKLSVGDQDYRLCARDGRPFARRTPNWENREKPWPNWQNRAVVGQNGKQTGAHRQAFCEASSIPTCRLPPETLAARPTTPHALPS